MMQALLAPLRELAELEEIQKEQKKEAGMLLLSNCSGSEKTHLMYGLSGEFRKKLIIRSSSEKAASTYEEYRFLSENVYLYPAKDFCGKIIVADIGIPNDIIEEAGFEAEIITESTVKDFVPSRPENSNKGTFGTLCLSCGSENMPGAALLALKAALVSGVGLCTVGSTENVKKLLQSQVPEAIYPSSSGRETAVLVGCGLTKNKEEVRRQLEKNLPTLLDACLLYTSRCV